jgi:8-oxo-dGTP pyrophosphatase MutT (NUDIX family)
MSVYFADLNEAEKAASAEINGKKSKTRCFGTVAYLPPADTTKVDFGESQWPNPNKKKIVCPRVLLVSTWTDGKFGFIGGASEGGENPMEAMTREFAEETGTTIPFESADHCFSIVGNNTATHIFARVTNDLDFFTSILAHFHTDNQREAYVEEVFTLVGLPIFLEGPADPAEFSWKKNIWGIARYLTFQNGILTPTLSGQYEPRDHFILILLKLKIVSVDLMKRIFALAHVFQRDMDPTTAGPVYLPSFDKFIAKSGVAAVLDDVLNVSQVVTSDSHDTSSTTAADTTATNATTAVSETATTATATVEADESLVDAAVPAAKVPRVDEKA